mmetsp:Transcript_10472/g.34725  ORF Transcript_10472/g.34725 Transcript_10472/m.34725 type:complete len:242 (+) Transcript_10472:3-728(+)
MLGAAAAAAAAPTETIRSVAMLSPVRSGIPREVGHGVAWPLPATSTSMVTFEAIGPSAVMRAQRSPSSVSTRTVTMPSSSASGLAMTSVLLHSSRESAAERQSSPSQPGRIGPCPPSTDPPSHAVAASTTSVSRPQTHSALPASEQAPEARPGAVAHAAATEVVLEAAQRPVNGPLPGRQEPLVAHHEHGPAAHASQVPAAQCREEDDQEASKPPKVVLSPSLSISTRSCRPDDTRKGGGE